MDFTLLHPFIYSPPAKTTQPAPPRAAVPAARVYFDFFFSLSHELFRVTGGVWGCGSSCLPSQLPGWGCGSSRLPALLTDCFMGRRSQAGREPGGGEIMMDLFFFFFLHSFLPVDKYQPTEVLKADIELVAPADLPPIRGMDIICGRRGQTASAPWCQHPAPPQPSPLKGGIEEPV